MKVEESVRLLVKTGSYVMGEKEVRALISAGKAKIVVFSRRADRELLELCEKSNVPTIKLEKTSMELGIVCGKPFPVSAIGVISEGDSDINSFRSTDG